MDDMDAFERQLSAEYGELMGPVRSVDDAAIFQAVTATRTPNWKITPAFGATRLLAGGAVVAIIGLFLAVLPSQPPTDDLGSAVSPVRSPSAGLVYGLDGDIYLANEDGSDPVRIVARGPDLECDGFGDPYVSPDGRHIASRSGWGDDCPGMVSVFDLDGGLVASVPGEGWDIAWAPDGSRFATWITLWETIGLYGIDGTLQAELPWAWTRGDHDPRWTHDGKGLLVPAGNVAARLPIDGSEPDVLLNVDPLSSWSASVAPDGSRVADVDGTFGAPSAKGWHLFVTALDGAGDERFSFEPGERVDRGWERRPVWSPDGGRIAVTTSRLSSDTTGEPNEESSSLWVVDLETGSATKAADQEGGGSLVPIAFSADGERLLVQSFDADFEPSLWTVAADGSGSSVIVPGAKGMWVLPGGSSDGSSGS